jgi:hypothetical protein
VDQDHDRVTDGARRADRPAAEPVESVESAAATPEPAGDPGDPDDLGGPGARPGPDAVDFGWVPAPGDWRRALRAVSPLLRGAPVFAVLAVVVGGYGIYQGDWLLGGLGLATAALVTALPQAQVALSFRRNPLAGRPVSGTADDTSLRLAIPDAAHSEVAWRSLVAWREIDLGFILRTGTYQRSPMYVVPLRAFADQAGQARFRRLLEHHLGAPS